MPKFLKNKFLIIFIAFAAWMLFWDSNSLSIHNILNKDIEKLENEKEYYKKEIVKDNKAIKELKKEEGLEKFAREEYYMKRENEDIYIIEYQDSLKVTTDE
ncbi:septum formation initiator family protein [Lacinutrix sp.]|uniref:FtsB family cell division protein n=1 Tax=Lacinutrix sp. TaxID=1937692 RepID=UPI0025C356A5|nr:septum formation initiator family protein [Lacinutrix sp.]